MSKKKQKNGFFYYMLDMKEELRRQGRNVPMNQMSALAGPRWSQLPDSQKTEYNIRAKHEKRIANPFVDVQSISRPGRMDCKGELLSERRDLATEKQEKRRKQREYLREILPVQRDVALIKFYFIDILPLCDLKDVERDRFIPCEMAILEYSLVHGIHKSVHHFVDPGPIPTGHRYAAQSQSDNTHTLPVSGFQAAEGDYRMLLSELQSFITTGMGPGPGAPLVFAKREFVDRIEFQLQWMADKAGVNMQITEVFELELLMVVLDSISNSLYPPRHDNGATPFAASGITEYQATELFNTTAYDFEPNTKCDWHEQREVNFCSLSVVNKYRYVMSDQLCSKFHVSITANHLPEQQDKPVATVKMPPVVPPGLRGVASDQNDLTSSIQRLVIGRGRGRGISGYSKP